MTRLGRLELVVRNLADRILGEEVSFDAIAEQEAAEQGAAYTAPAPPADPEAQRAFEQALVAKVDAMLAELAPLVAATQQASATERLARLEARLMAQERAVQVVLQALEAITSIGSERKAG